MIKQRLFPTHIIEVVPNSFTFNPVKSIKSQEYTVYNKTDTRFIFLKISQITDMQN